MSLDIQHSYIEKGSGEPLILIHGNGESKDYFIHQIDPFSEKYRVIALDSRGHGQTPRGQGPFNLIRLADDLNIFLDRLSISSAHILGFSDGANIAMLFSLRYPKRVKKLILNAGNINPRGIAMATQFRVEFEYQTAMLKAETFPEEKLKAEILSLMIGQPNISIQDLKRISMPTLVIAGTNDLIKEKHTRLIAESIPNSKLVIILGDHELAFKKPESFNYEVLTFLDDK